MEIAGSFTGLACEAVFSSTPASDSDERKRLRRRIGKANVMLGLGQISPAGYSRYTNPIREKLAQLECEFAQSSISLEA